MEKEVMSELSSIPEQVLPSPTKPKTICPVCSHDEVNIKKLKTHILLKHPKVNLCLFCIEKKGWSDTFATQSSYNQHYKGKIQMVLEFHSHNFKKYHSLVKYPKIAKFFKHLLRYHSQLTFIICDAES